MRNGKSLRDFPFFCKFQFSGLLDGARPKASLV